MRPQAITPPHQLCPSFLFTSLAYYKHTGEITPQMVEWLSSIEKKDLNHCGKLVLTGDMNELSITKVDLSNMFTLEGKLHCCPSSQVCLVLGGVW